MRKKSAAPDNPNEFGSGKELKMKARQSAVHGDKIFHSKLLRDLQHSKEIPSTLVEIYQRNVLSGKTRTIRLLGRKYPARILHTLLGYEVQASYKRIQCPDMVTARYLRLFTELGCRSIKLPYDPTVTASLVPEMEACIANISKGIRIRFPKDPTLQNYVLRKIYAIIRGQLKESI